MDYTVIYSDRKTLSLSVKDGMAVVRAPRRVPKSVVESFVEKHADWIYKTIEKQKKASEIFSALTDAEVLKLKKQAKLYFKVKAEEYSKIMGLDYGRITITSAKSRFGSCSSKGNISFSYRLMLYPEAAREYVVVHELAHLVHMNHSKAFYSVIEKTLPNYKERRRMLK
jgi:predicted metal-dependent hydrolase